MNKKLVYQVGNNKKLNLWFILLKTVTPPTGQRLLQKNATLWALV